MNSIVVPKKLKEGDHVRIISPSYSLSVLSEETQRFALEHLTELGLTVSFGKNCRERDEFNSSSIEKRISDLHDAFSDPEVACVMPALGGYASNQLLSHIDWELVKANPKVLCGFSDITVLNNAILTKTGMVSYSGPHFRTFGIKRLADYTLEFFRKCLFGDGAYRIVPSTFWTDFDWWKEQERSEDLPNPGWIALSEGECEGRLIGGNLGSLCLLTGTQYCPDYSRTVLFLEDDELAKPHIFDRQLQSLLHLPAFGISGLMIGRFKRDSGVTIDLLRRIIKSKPDLDGIPVIANVDFGHTEPKATLPVGGIVRLSVSHSSSERNQIEILDH